MYIIYSKPNAAKRPSRCGGLVGYVAGELEMIIYSKPNAAKRPSLLELALDGTPVGSGVRLDELARRWLVSCAFAGWEIHGTTLFKTLLRK
jgi:hypothetical protein